MNITIEELKNEEINQCRELCNELMKYQQSKAKIAPECFELMNFETRMKKSYELAKNSLVLIAKVDEIPVGYIFSTIDSLKNPMKNFPDWAPNKRKIGVKGFYPEWLSYPQKIGCLSNFYLKEDYRNLGIGKKLFDETMKWFKRFSDVEIVFAYISNGNEKALNFYLENGFKYSHEVFGGFIKTTFFKN